MAPKLNKNDREQPLYSKEIILYLGKCKKVHGFGGGGLQMGMGTSIIHIKHLF